MESAPPIAPELRSYDSLERLRGVLSSVNVGRTVLDHETKHAVTLQSSDGFDSSTIEGEPMRIKPELGCALMSTLFPMDQALLEVRTLPAAQLLEWIDHYPIFSFGMALPDRPDEQITGIGTRRGLEGTKDAN